MKNLLAGVGVFSIIVIAYIYFTSPPSGNNQLTDCLNKAQKIYDDTFMLNSTETDKPGVRKWKSILIAQNTQQRLDADRNTCISAYK